MRWMLFQSKPINWAAFLTLPQAWSTRIVKASNISVKRECLPAQGTEMVLMPHVEQLATVADSDRRGYVFRPGGIPRTRTRVGKKVSAIGKAAGVVTDHREKDRQKIFATAHDLRRSFGFRWSRRAMPAVLRELMRHESLETTMRYYAGVNAEATADELWKSVEGQAGNSLGNTPATPETADSEKTLELQYRRRGSNPHALAGTGF